MRITATIAAANMPTGVIIHPREQLRQMRAKVAEAAQRLIDILDWIDGDPDLEDGADLEQVSEDEGAQCDDEGFDADSEPNADDQDNSWNVVAFAMDQTGTGWATGNRDSRP